MATAVKASELAVLRYKQVDSLRQYFPTVKEIQKDAVYEVPVLLPTKANITIRITLGSNFPNVPPALRVSPAVTHKLIDGNMNIKAEASTKLQQWHPAQNLGKTMYSIVQKLIQEPPSIGGALSSSNGNGSAASYEPVSVMPSSSAGGAIGYAMSDSTPASSQKQSSSVSVPPIPDSFPELQAMKPAQLGELLNDDAAFRKYLMAMDSVRNMVSLRNELRASQTGGDGDTAALDAELAEAREALEREKKSMSMSAVPSPSKIVSHDKRKADRSNQPPKKASRHLDFEDDDDEDFDNPILIENAGPTVIPRATGVDDVAAQAKWPRAEAPVLTPGTDRVVFMQMECDQQICDNPFPGMPGSSVGPVAVLRLYGVTKEGYSVMANVHGFAHYFYILAPQSMQQHECGVVMKAMEELMQKSAGQQNKAPRYVLAVALIDAQSILGFSERTSKFLKITMALPQHVATLRNKLEGAALILPPPYGQRSYQTYEADVPFALRFMIDRKIVGASWVELPPGAYSVRPERTPAQRGGLFLKSSFCQYECDIAYDKLLSFAPEGEYETIAPLRILSFDIECAGRPGVFPDASRDPVIQIAAIVTLHGQTKPFIKNVFNLGTCSPIVGCQVIACKTEQELLMRWRDFVNVVDPDLVIGYNINNFDLPYLIDRASTLGLQQFKLLSRLREYAVKVKDAKFSSKAYGTRESKETQMNGRVVFDILQVIQRDYKLRAYSLNAVSEHFLGEQKEDVHYSIISELFNGSADDRRRLAVYCVKDAMLPQRLMDKLMMSFNYIEMARVTGVPFDFLLSRGQQIKVISQLYRNAQEENLLIPYYKSEGSSADVKYEGATVIDPTRGFYEQPISTLDFASLYPSIMMAHNLCYSSLLSLATVKEMGLVEDVDYIKTPSNAYFVKASRRQGLLPRILRQLLAARAKAKAELKNEKDPFRRAVLDGRQLALKISANSVYGFTGATVGKLPCLEISGSVTAFGRDMIAVTKELVQRQYTIENGYEHNAEVIYGDTDSVMVRFGTSELSEAMRLGKEAAEHISKHFMDPIRLEFEKVYHPYLLINKKRYAGLLWTKTDKFDKMDTKGLETVRRDNCLMVSNVVRDCLHKLLIERDVDGAVSHAKQVISDLLQNKLDLSLLVISKSLSKDASDYAGKQAHVELAERMRKRDPATAPAMGDRVPYVIIKAAKGAKAFEKAEDPLYVLENDIPLDYQYYLENQLENPLTRIFEPIMGDCRALFHGDHTRNIVVPTPKRGGIMNFAIKREVCIGCRSALAANETHVCSNCRPHEVDIYQQLLATANSLEQQFARVWTQCQSCQGSFHQTVLCTSRDCPVFYTRQKVQKDLKLAEESLDKFEVAW